ncbi:ribosomal-processing cysteine protease Prp [Clostridia bacterium]|nr:ribosomal-processing cysteine protease Prp [Clostridia bacterium]
MITVRFGRTDGKVKSVSVSGHAEHSNHGQDIVCAGVSSAVQMVVNGLVEILKLECDVQKSKNKVEVLLKDLHCENTEAGHMFLEAFRLHMELLSREYEGTINVIVTEG